MHLDVQLGKVQMKEPNTTEPRKPHAVEDVHVDGAWEPASNAQSPGSAVFHADHGELLDQWKGNCQ